MSKVATASENLLGKSFKTKHGEVFEVVDYINCDNVLIRYEDGTTVTTKAVNIRVGNPANPNRPVIFNTGYHGIGEFKINEKGKKTDSYVKWHGMLCRVFEGNNTNRKDSLCYKGVSVSDDWLNFQNFAKWFYSQKALYSCNEVLCLDKDLFSNTKKIYSASTCCLLPYKLNISIQLATVMPFDKTKRRFSPRVSINGKFKHIGNFAEETEAWYHYCTAKDKLIKEIAESYTEKIPDFVIDKLRNFNSLERTANLTSAK